MDVLRIYPLGKRLMINLKLYDLSDGSELNEAKKREIGEICIFIRAMIVDPPTSQPALL